MESTDLTQAISQTDFDLDGFARQASTDAALRAEILRQMLTNDDIMVYYHCFYVLERISETQPELLLPAWNEFVGLLAHPNSYHRDFGLTLISNLSGAVDRQRVLDVFEAYFACLRDPKYMTAWYCARFAVKMLPRQPALGQMIVDRLLELPTGSRYKAKQLALLQSEVLDALEWAYLNLDDRAEYARRIAAETTSLSPKTRKKAKEMLRRLNCQPTG